MCGCEFTTSQPNQNLGQEVYQETEYYPENMDDPFADTLLDFETPIPLRRSQALFKTPDSSCKKKCKKLKHLKNKKAAAKSNKAAPETPSPETPAPKQNRLNVKTSPSQSVEVPDQLPLPPMLPTDVQPQGPRKGRLSYTVRSSHSSAVVEACCWLPTLLLMRTNAKQ